MRTDKYYSAGAELAERGGFLPYRHKIEGDRYLLSESDIRNMIAFGLIEIDELPSLDIIEVSAAEADQLILEGKAEETREAAGADAVEGSGDDANDGTEAAREDSVEMPGGGEDERENEETIEKEE